MLKLKEKLIFGFFKKKTLFDNYYERYEIS